MTRCQHTGSSCIHRRFEPQAYKVGPEQVGFWEIAGLTAFVLFMFGVVIYAGPILMEGLLR